jgi:hypothetical protein
MVTSTGQAVFAVVAKDAATKTLGNVGKGFGNLKRTGVSALKGIAAASVVAATALIGLGIGAIKAAADEELQIIRLNAALRARGFALDEIGPKVEAEILALRRFGIADSEVREGLETGSRFFKNQEKLFKASSIAANIAAATGDDYSTILLNIGKAAKGGSAKGLAKYLGVLEQGVTLTDIGRKANEKFGGVAEEIANSTAIKFAAAQEALNDEFEALGTQFLPRVTEGLKFFTDNILPELSELFSEVGPIIGDVVDKYIVPLFESVDDLSKTLGFKGGFGEVLLTVIDLALIPFKIILGTIKGLLDGINEAFRIFNSLASSKTGALLSGNARSQYLSGGNLGTASPMGGTSSYLQTNIDFSIGTQKQDKLVSDSLIRQGTGRRGGY